MVIPLGRPLPSGSCDQLGTWCRRGPRRRGNPAAPIRSCSRWGLPCPSRHRESGVLLPRRFTLACSRGCPRAQAVCFLLHFPSSHLDWPLTSTQPMEPGLSSTATSADATIHRTPAGSRPEYSAPVGCALPILRKGVAAPSLAGQDFRRHLAAAGAARLATRVTVPYATPRAWSAGERPTARLTAALSLSASMAWPGAAPLDPMSA